MYAGHAGICGPDPFHKHREDTSTVRDQAQPTRVYSGNLRNRTRYSKGSIGKDLIGISKTALIVASPLIPYSAISHVYGNMNKI